MRKEKKSEREEESWLQKWREKGEGGTLYKIQSQSPPTLSFRSLNLPLLV